MKTVLAVILLFAAAFCVFGFIASGEPGPKHIYFRIGYPVVGLLCLTLAVAALVQPRKK